MDAQLRLAGIKAHRDPKGVEALWKYIRILERVQGISGDSGQLYAVLYDDDPLEGDSLFTACGTDFLPYTEGECQYSLLDKWIKDRWGGDSEILDEYSHEIKGFWVVDEGVQDFCEMIEEVGIGDSYCYAANTQRKSHCEDHAIKTVKWHDECPCPGCQPVLLS